MNDPSRTAPSGPASAQPSPLDLSTEAYYWKPMAAYFRALELDVYRHAGVALSGPALDLGCGDGLVAETLAAQGSMARRPVGVDLAAGELRKAVRRDAHGGLAVADGVRLPFPDARFDALVCNGVLQAIPEMAAALGEVRRVVRPGGRVAITVPTVRFDAQLPVATLCGLFGERRRARYVEGLRARLPHRHALEVSEWVALLEGAGLEVSGTWGFLSARESRVWNVLSLQVCRLFGVLSLPGVAALRPLWVRLARLSLGPLLREGPVPADRAGYVLLVATRR